MGGRGMKETGTEPGPQSPHFILSPQPQAGALYIFTDKSKNLYSLCGSTLVSLQVS